MSADSLEVVRRAARAHCAGLSQRVRQGTHLRLLRRWFGLLGVATQRAVAHSVLYTSVTEPVDTLERVVPVGDLPEA